MTPTLKEKLSAWRIEPVDRQPYWIPGQSFVYHYLDFGPAVSGEDLESALELHIEESSPLPLEQVAWGYYQAEGSSALLLYMTHRGTAFKAEDPHESDCPAYPSLLCALPEPPHQTCLRLVLSDSDLCAVHFNSGNALPQKVSSVVLGQRIDTTQADQFSDEHIHCIRAAEAKLRAKLPADAQDCVDPNILSILSSKVLDDRTVEVITREIHPDGQHTVNQPARLLDSRQFYQCDVRDKAFIKQKQKAALQEKRLQQAVKIGLYSIAVLILLQLFLVLGNSWLNARANKVPDRLSAVDRVNQKEQLLNSIELFSITAFQPFEALEQMNNYRPDSLYFENMQAGTEGKKAEEQFFIQLRGIASSAAEADLFAKKLEEDANFLKVDISDIRSQTRQTDFRLFVQLSGRPSSELTSTSSE